MSFNSTQPSSDAQKFSISIEEHLTTPGERRVSRDSVKDKQSYSDNTVQIQSNTRKKWLQGTLSLGILPIGRLFFQNIAPRIILPSRYVDDSDKAKVERDLNENLNNITNLSSLTSLTLNTKDNATLDGMIYWHKDNTDKQFENQKWIIYCPGNGEFYEQKLAEAEQLSRDTGANLLYFNYRGVGQSSGSLTRTEDLITDGCTALKYLEYNNVNPENVLIWGHSLGGGVATQVAARNEKVSLIVSRSFSSIQNFAKNLVPVIGRPLGFFLKTYDLNLDSAEKWKVFLEKGRNVGILYHNQDSLITKATSLWKSLRTHADNVDSKNNDAALKANLKSKAIKLKDIRGGESSKLLAPSQNIAMRFSHNIQKYIGELNYTNSKDKIPILQAVNECLEAADFYFHNEETETDELRNDPKMGKEAIKAILLKLDEIIAYAKSTESLSNNKKNHRKTIKNLENLRDKFLLVDKKIELLSEEELEKFVYKGLEQKYNIKPLHADNPEHPGNPHNYSYTPDDSHYEDITKMARQLLKTELPVNETI